MRTLLAALTALMLLATPVVVGDWEDTKKAAEPGDAEAQTNLCQIYRKGEGVPQDYVQAYAWYSLTAAQGFEKAKQDKGIVEKRMTRSQVVEAQKLA